LSFCFSAQPSKHKAPSGKHAKLNGLRHLEIGKALTQMSEKGDRPEDFVSPHEVKE
jgi:hypothetical protein